MAQTTIEKMAEKLKEQEKRLEEVETLAHKCEAFDDEHLPLLGALQQTAIANEAITQRFFMAIRSQQVLTEALVRYIAGYTAETYEAEVNQAVADSGKPGGMMLGNTSKDFDTDRFRSLCDKVAEVTANLAKKAREDREKEMERLQAEEDKPKIEVVSPIGMPDLKNPNGLKAV
jgi:hypothetical protein